MEKRKYARLGSISSATHRPSDLTDRFWSALYELDPKRAEDLALEYPWFFSHDQGTIISLERGPHEQDAKEFMKRLADADVGFVFIPGCDKIVKDKIVLTAEWEGPDEDDEWWQTDDCNVLINETLYSELEEFAPPFCYFGTSQGDGADFGFWYNDDAVSEAVAEGRAFKLEAGTTWKVEEYQGEKVLNIQNPKVDHVDWIEKCRCSELEYVVEVTDHGNVTVFDLDGKEIFGVV
jgi:hypothetical protein